MEFPIDLLPREVLHIVFSYLNVPDRLNSCLVCKKWLETMNCKYFLKDIKVHINDNRTVPIFSSTSRDFLNFSFKLIIVDNKYYELFKRFSSYIEYLSFEKCEVWKREPVNFDDLTYDNLKVLKIIDCDLWTLLPSLPNLSELYLTGKSTITDDGFAILQKTMKHLKTLSLLCNVSFERKVYRRFYPREMTYETNPSSLILSLPAIQSFISERASTLKELNFASNLTPLALKDISSIKNLSLNKIGLDCCHECTDGLIDLFRNQPSLKIVNLNGIRSVNDGIVDALCSLVPNVEEILVHFCSLTEKCLNKLFQLTKLKKLDISNNEPLSAIRFNKAISNFKAVQMKSLNLSGMLKEVKYMVMDVLFIQCKYLVYLDLSCCHIPDTVVHGISEHLVHLEYLNLKRCDITDYALTGYKTEAQLLCVFNPIYVNGRTPLSNLKNLRKLKLNYCDISDVAVIEVIKFQYLKILNLSGCKLRFSTVETLLLQNPSIEKIYWDGDNIEHPIIGKKQSKTYFDDFMDERFVRDDVFYS